MNPSCLNFSSFLHSHLPRVELKLFQLWRRATGNEMFGKKQSKWFQKSPNIISSGKLVIILFHFKFMFCLSGHCNKYTKTMLFPTIEICFVDQLHAENRLSEMDSANAIDLLFAIFFFMDCILYYLCKQQPFLKLECDFSLQPFQNIFNYLHISIHHFSLNIIS